MTVRILPSVVLVLAYIASAIVSGSFWAIGAEDLLRLGGSFAPALAGGEWWRLVSAAFLHGSILHLLVNAVVLADALALIVAFGGQDRLSGGMVVRLSGVFLLAAAAGFVASAWWSRETVSVGASGGILGLYGFALASAWSRARPRLAAAPRRRALLVAAGYLLVAVLAGFLVPGIDNVAHLGGLFAGAVLGCGTGRGFRSAAGAALLLSVAFAVAALPGSWAEPYRQRRDFELAYRQFSAADRAANEAIALLLRKLRSGSGELPARVAELDREVIAPLRANLAYWRLREAAVATGALDGEWQRWRRYGEQRLRAALALRAALLANTLQAQEEALREFDLAVAEAGEIAELAEVERAQAGPD